MIAFTLANALHIPLPDNSVQMVATSPPYLGLRNYNVAGQIGLESSPQEYIAKLVEVFREVKRVLRPDGVVWLNLGDSYSGSGKSRGGGGQGPTSGKQLTNRGAYFDIDKGKRNGNGHGRCGGGGLTGKQLMMIPARVAIALQDAGWYLRSEIVWAKPNPMPESVTDRPTKSHEMIYLLAKQPRYYYDAEAVREPYTEPMNRWGGQKLVAKGESSWDAGTGQNTYRDRDMRPSPAGRNRRDVWTVTPQSYSGAHFAVWPEKLVEPMVKAGSKPGDLVLDPFAGSGTTGRVCAKLGRRFIGLDLNPEYFKLAAERTAEVQMTTEAVSASGRGTAEQQELIRDDKRIYNPSP